MFTELFPKVEIPQDDLGETPKDVLNFLKSVLEAHQEAPIKIIVRHFFSSP
jgi:hypothetical protein